MHGDVLTHEIDEPFAPLVGRTRSPTFLTVVVERVSELASACAFTKSAPISAPFGDVLTTPDGNAFTVRSFM